MAEAIDRGSTAGRVTGAAICLLAALATLPAAVAAMMSVMMFDSPGSEGVALVWAMVLGMWAAPIVCLATAAFGLLAAIRFTRRRLVIAVALPLLWFVYEGAAVLLLESMCSGRFAC